MQPYQKASEQSIRQSELPGQALASAAKTGLGIAGGGAILNRVMPFLNKYIDPELAIKGLNKIDPRFGKFVSGALGQGMGVEEIGNFIKEKVTGEKPQEEEKQKQPQQPRNIIEEHAPDIHEILVDRIGQGLTPIKAAIQLFGDSKYKKKIEELQKKTGQNFEKLVTSVFGGEGLGPRSQQELNAPPQPNQQQQMQQSQSSQQNQQAQAQPSKVMQALQTGDVNEVMRNSNISHEQALNLIHNFNQQKPAQQGGANQQLMQALQMAAQSRQRRQQPK